MDCHAGRSRWESRIEPITAEQYTSVTQQMEKEGIYIISYTCYYFCTTLALWKQLETNHASHKNLFIQTLTYSKQCRYRIGRPF